MDIVFRTIQAFIHVTDIISNGLRLCGEGIDGFKAVEDPELDWIHPKLFGQLIHRSCDSCTLIRAGT